MTSIILFLFLLHLELNDAPSPQSPPLLPPLQCFRTESLRQQFKYEVGRWKAQYSERLHQEVKKDMEAVTESMVDIRSRLERDVKDFASLQSVMDAQASVREAQSWIDFKFDSITNRYNALEKCLPAGIMGEDDIDAKSVLKSHWSGIMLQNGEKYAAPCSTFILSCNQR